jgi:hypothetical protein
VKQTLFPEQLRQFWTLQEIQALFNKIKPLLHVEQTFEELQMVQFEMLQVTQAFPLLLTTKLPEHDEQ